jgi:glycosyltransferase involved in cell wall biosynthesis
MTLVSSTETFSIAALESMALGKPLVMTDVGGASEQVVHGETGLLFESGDIDALTQHLATLTSPALRSQMGAAAKQRVRERYTLEAMTAGFTEEMTRLLGSGDLQRPAWLSHYGHGDRRLHGGSGRT